MLNRYMNPARSVIVAFVASALLMSTAIAAAKLSFAGSGAGSLSVGMLDRYTDMGLGGTLSIGLRPFRNSQDVEFLALAAYDRFANKTTGMGAYSFVRIGGGIRLNLEASSPNRIYLMLHLGPAFTKVAKNSGFPPFGRAKMSTTNLYGAGGIGCEFGAAKPVGLFLEAELVDILDSLFGDYRFLRLNVGLRL